MTADCLLQTRNMTDRFSKIRHYVLDPMAEETPILFGKPCRPELQPDVVTDSAGEGISATRFT